MKEIAIFASGNGSNFESIVAKFNHHTSTPSNGSISLLICDKPEAYVIERAEKWGVPTIVLQPKAFSSKTEYEQRVLEELKHYDIHYIVLAGYMRLIGPTLLEEYKGRIVNIHPSLLPAFPGKDAINQAIQAGVRISGVTVHFVDEGMDTGPIIAQEAVRVEEAESEQSLAKKIHEVEHRLYPKVVQDWIDGKVWFKEGKIKWRK